MSQDVYHLITQRPAEVKRLVVHADGSAVLEVYTQATARVTLTPEEVQALRAVLPEVPVGEPLTWQGWPGTQEAPRRAAVCHAFQPQGAILSRCGTMARVDTVSSVPAEVTCVSCMRLMMDDAAAPQAAQDASGAQDDAEAGATDGRTEGASGAVTMPAAAVCVGNTVYRSGIPTTPPCPQCGMPLLAVKPGPGHGPWLCQDHAYFWEYGDAIHSTPPCPQCWMPLTPWPARDPQGHLSPAQWWVKREGDWVCAGCQAGQRGYTWWQADLDAAATLGEEGR